jgi:hypothetical protein
MHGNHAAHVAQPAADASPHAEHAEHHAHHSVPAPQTSNVCTCLGMCCVAPSIGAPKPSVELSAAVVVDVAVAGYREPVAPDVRRDHALPFGNGPPTTRVA